MLESDLNYKTYATNGSTTVFPITFQFWADSDIVASLRDDTTLVVTDLAITTDYTLSGGDGETGSLTTVATYATGSTILIERQTSQQQTVDLASTDDFDAESLEAQLDKTVAMVQEVSTESGLSVQGNKFDAETVDFELPAASAGKALKWNATATGFENSEFDPDEAEDAATAASASASAAATSASDASDSADEAAASAATINLPDISGSDVGDVLVVNAGKTGYDFSARNGFVDRGDPSTYDFDITDLTTDGTFRNLDLSAIVGSRSVLVALRVLLQDDAAASVFRVRTNGNSNTRNSDELSTQVANVNNYGTMMVYTDSNGVVEYSATNTVWSALNIAVAGWWL